MTRPLCGLRVLELGDSQAAGVAALLLCNHGAEVIRLDTPPAGETVPSHEDAVTFGLGTSGERLCDRGKKRVFLDLSDAEQRSLFSRLLDTCDAVLDGFPPGFMARLGLSLETLRQKHPDLVYTSVTGYGTSGPYADRPWSEAAVQAESGFVSTTGTEDSGPLRSGGDTASFFGGLLACIGTLTALLDQRGGGRYVDISMMDSLLFGLENQFSLYLKSGVVPKPRGNRYALSAPVGNFPCGDGREIMISVATEAQWAAFAEALDRETWLTRPEYSNVSRRIQNDSLLGREVAEAFSAWSREDLMARLQSRHCVYGCINDFPAVLEHVQTAARGTFMEAVDCHGERRTVSADPILMDGAHHQNAEIHPSGADTVSVLSEFPTGKNGEFRS